MCGVFGIYGQEGKDIVTELYDGLISLQHRGHDAAGIITYDKQFHLAKGLGYVREVFIGEKIRRLRGNIGIGHVRYSTVGGGGVEDAQPFFTNSPYGIALCHNGNLFNYSELKKELFKKDLRQVNSGCDAEVILNVFASELRKAKAKSLPEKVFYAVNMVFRRCHGAYSVVGIIAGKGMFAFRDPYGIRPLIFGQRDGEYVFSSESVMFFMMGFQYLKDVGAGECIFIDKKHRVWNKQIAKPKLQPCIFEYVYIARPDSLQNYISVYKTRLRMGETLAKRIKPLLKKLKIDVVIPAPATSNTAALSLASELGLKYREGLVKNQFIGRTFIMPNQHLREKSVRYKLNPQILEIRGKNVLLLDDSIVRGTTSKEIVKILKKSGAKKVYFISASPPIKSPCFYGIDIPTRRELIANRLSLEKIKKYIDADLLVYQDIKDLVKCVRIAKSPAQQFCTACFTGKYPTPGITEKVMRMNEKQRLKERK